MAKPMSREEWQSLSIEQKASLRAERRSDAINAVKEGEFPDGVRVKIGDYTLTLKPTGLSGKGNVSYSHPATTLQVGGRNVRINALNVSVFAGATDSDTDMENGEFI